MRIQFTEASIFDKQNLLAFFTKSRNKVYHVSICNNNWLLLNIDKTYSILTLYPIIFDNKVLFEKWYNLDTEFVLKLKQILKRKTSILDFNNKVISIYKQKGKKNPIIEADTELSLDSFEMDWNHSKLWTIPSNYPETVTLVDDIDHTSDFDYKIHSLEGFKISSIHYYYLQNYGNIFKYIVNEHYIFFQEVITGIYMIVPKIYSYNDK